MSNQGQPIPEIRLPQISGRWIGLIIGAVVLIAIIFSSVYTIEPEEVGVILTLGRFSRVSEPGLHIKAPFGIEKLYKVPVRRQLKEEFGFRTIQSGVRSSFERRGYEDESLMLTGDLNSAVVEWIVQYKISDPERFLFRVRSPQETFRSISEAAMRKIVGDRSVTEVLTTGRVEVADEVKQILQRQSSQYELGIDVQVVVLQNVNPPAPVQPSFNEVNEAIQEKEKMINQAVADYNQAIPRAEGEALATVLAAEGYAVNRVNRAKGDVALFNALLTEYRKAPDVTRRRLYVESMREILTGMERKVIVDEALRGVLPLLPLGREEVKP